MPDIEAIRELAGRFNRLSAETVIAAGVGSQSVRLCANARDRLLQLSEYAANVRPLLSLTDSLTAERDELRREVERLTKAIEKHRDACPNIAFKEDVELWSHIAERREGE